MAAFSDHFYSYSLDKDGRLISIKDAIKGADYFCPCCGDIMIPKQGMIRRWHFAHKGNLGKCTYETYLHKIAKMRIRECYLRASEFYIFYYPKAICSVADCPLGSTTPCNWNITKSFNLKELYDICDEEAKIGNFRADLLLTHSDIKRSPTLIEIKVTHKSSEEKIRSGYKIIEIGIDSEEDINQIVSYRTIRGTQGYLDDWNETPNEKIKFYNFKTDFMEIPDTEHQAIKYQFWIDVKGYIHSDKAGYCNNMSKCLSPNPTDIEHALFRIESKERIFWDFAFQKLSQSGLGIRYCAMCRNYCFNSYYGKPICILYKSKGTKQFPRLMDAMECPHFKQADFYINPTQECKITQRPTQLWSCLLPQNWK